ncbi:MAG: hypothetical protein ACI4DO_01175 [Roseburia sp.]
MLPGVYLAKKKNGEIYYRSNITYQNKHISLGSYSNEQDAHRAYLAANEILQGSDSFDSKAFSQYQPLSYDKIVSLYNFRDNRIYIKTPIYLHASYFSYYLSPGEELKFDIDDLFFYSSHRILRRQGHLYINDYGMQVSLLSRYGIKNYGVAGRDYRFVNGDATDLRYSNIEIISKYNGVTAIPASTGTRYRAIIHINGNYKIGTYKTEAKAAIAYNKAVDLALTSGLKKNFAQNYVTEYTAKEYADLYVKIKISPKYLAYLEAIQQP